MQTARNLNELYQQIRLRKVPFFITFFIVMVLSYGFLVIIDFVPEPVAGEGEVETTPTPNAVREEESNTSVEVLPAAPAVEEVEPISIYIEKLNKEIAVLNPKTNDIATLDEALLEGVVRHPDSADFSDPGNIFILGHSSYLPNVLNKNFQAFNGIQDLTWGDKIYLSSAGAEYTYRVNKVYKAKASEVVVPHTPGEARLTLATCNSFGSKDDRYIVEAVLIEDTVATAQ